MITRDEILRMAREDYDVILDSNGVLLGEDDGRWRIYGTDWFVWMSDRAAEYLAADSDL